MILEIRLAIPSLDITIFQLNSSGFIFFIIDLLDNMEMSTEPSVVCIEGKGW